jgi:hypothetical protein
MARLSLERDSLCVELSTFDQVLSVHGSFTVPLRHVAGARTTKPPSFWESLKVIGTNWPWGKMAGTFLYHGEAVFFDYAGNEDAVLVIDLSTGNYKHLFVHVDAPETPEAAAERINSALATASSAG